MMKLTKANIKFIDRYLENSDVRHIDIRMEMLDHVATAIEKEMEETNSKSFKNAFKNYMIKNKSTLIETKHQFVKVALIKNLKLIAQFCFSIRGIAVGVFIFCLFYFGLTHYGVETVKKTLRITAVAVFIFPIFTYFVLIYVLKLEKVSSVDRLGVAFIVVFQFANLANQMTHKRQDWTLSPELIALLISVFFTLVIALTVVGCRVIRKANSKNKNLQLQ